MEVYRPMRQLEKQKQKQNAKGTQNPTNLPIRSTSIHTNKVTLTRRETGVLIMA